MQPRSYVRPTLEPVAGLRQKAFLMKAFAKPRFDFLWHLHPEVELTYIQKGYGVRYVGTSIQPFYEGDLCLLGGNLPHAYGSDPRHKGVCRWMVLHFRAEFWGDAFWKLTENRSLTALLRVSRQGLRFSGGIAAAVGKCMADLQDMPAGDGRRLLCFLEILHQLNSAEERTKLNGGAQPESGKTVDPRVGQVLQWLEEHAMEEIAQEEVAGLIGMSAPAFSRFFHHKTGKLFSQHLNEMRVARAQTALFTTRKSVAEIAFESGFNNLANFNRRFAEITRMTPSEYRRRSGAVETP